jgi:hypothetical protein
MDMTAIRGLCLLLLIGAPGVARADDATISCLQEKLPITKAKLTVREYGTQFFTFSVTNNLSYAVSGLYIRTVLKSAERTVPWLDSTMSFDVAGGVEPGEARTIKGFGISLLPSDTPEDVPIAITILDAADPEKHPIDGAVQFLSWSPDKSPLGCK